MTSARSANDAALPVGRSRGLSSLAYRHPHRVRLDSCQPQHWSANGRPMSRHEPALIESLSFPYIRPVAAVRKSTRLLRSTRPYLTSTDEYSHSALLIA